MKKVTDLTLILPSYKIIYFTLRAISEQKHLMFSFLQEDSEIFYSSSNLRLDFIPPKHLTFIKPGLSCSNNQGFVCPKIKFYS